jgi:transposase
MFVDEADIDLLPGITRCWTKKGEQKNVSTFGKNEKRYVFGGVDVITGETIHLIRESKRSFDFVDFLFLVKSKYPNGATICLDNSAIHKSKVTAEFLEKDDKIRLFFLPKYSPGLNGMECIWRYMRHRVTYNYFFGTINRLIEAVDNFFNYLSSGQSLRLVYSSAAFR